MKNDKTSRRVFIQDGKPVGLIGGTDNRYRQEDGALVVLPDERWGNPLFAAACLDEHDFHIHARLTLDELAGTGASVLLGGHYHYSSSLPYGNVTFRISLDEDITPARKSSLDKAMHIVHGITNPRMHWNLDATLLEKEVVGVSSDFITPGEPFTIDLYRRGKDMTLEINSQRVFGLDLSDGNRIPAGRCGDAGWPVNFGFMPGHGVMRIHDFHATGSFPEPVFPTTDAWHFNTLGYSHYRLPALCTTAGGRLLAFVEARLSRLSRNWEWESDWVKDEFNCVMKYSDDHGVTWSPQQVVINEGASYQPCSPVPLMDSQTGELFLFSGRGPWLMTSKDEGRSWSEPRLLADFVPGEFRDCKAGVGNCVIQLRHGPRRGRLLIALYKEDIIALMFSDDHGKTWQPGALATFSGAWEPSIVELADGRLLVSPRIGVRVGANPVGRLFLFSDDSGASFSEQRYETGIPIPGQGEMIAIEPSSELSTRALVFCGAAEGKTRLTLKVSLDDGKTWPISRMIDDGAAANLALVALPAGEVGVLYERDKYRRLCFQRVNLNAVINQGSDLK